MSRSYSNDRSHEDLNWKKLQDRACVGLFAEMLSSVSPCEKTNQPCATKAINTARLMASNAPDTACSRAIVSNYLLTVIVTNN